MTVAAVAVAFVAVCVVVGWACLAADRRAGEHAAANRRIIHHLRSHP